MNIDEQFNRVSTFIFDVDGVLTDGSILVLENGLQARRMNIRDGYALQLAVKKGYRVLVISGAATSPAEDRLRKLGIQELHFGIPDKRLLVQEYMKQHDISKEEVLFMGDDHPDYSAMQVVGLPVCPADAIEDVRTISKYISPINGGQGCVRDVIEKVMRMRGDWQHDTDIASR